MQYYFAFKSVLDDSPFIEQFLNTCNRYTVISPFSNPVSGEWRQKIPQTHAVSARWNLLLSSMLPSVTQRGLGLLSKGVCVGLAARGISVWKPGSRPKTGSVSNFAILNLSQSVK